MSRSITKGQQRATDVVSGARNGFTGGGATGSPTSKAAAAFTKEQFYTAEELLPYISEAEKANLKQEVLNSINTELLLNTDLEVTVPRLLRSCQNESRELRRAMNSIASSQIVEAQRALQIVKSNYGKVQELRELFLKQGDLIQGLGADTLSYKHLRQLHCLRDNVSSVIKWSEALKEVRYGNLYMLVEQQSFRFMYGRLRNLQLIRRTVITKAGARYRSFQAVFEPYFEKLDVILSMFVNQVYKFLREDAMVIAIQRALEDGPSDDGSHCGTGFAGAGENKGDEEAPEPYECLRQCIAICGDEIENPVLNFGSDGVETESQINEEAIYSAVAKGVAQLWEEQIMQDVVDPFRQISVYLEQMKKVEPLLGAFELTLFPLSTKLPFFRLVVQAVHAEVMNVMQSYSSPSAELEANGLIEASLFIQWYEEMMVTNSYAQYVDFSAIDELSASFMTAAVGGLSAHLTRLCRACAITVCNDLKGPTILSSGLPITTGPVDVFSVLQQSLAGMNTAIDVTVMRKIGKACADAIYAYLDECKQRTDFDYWEDENNSLPSPQPAEEWQQRRMLFLYAFCNDCTTIENNLDTIELKFASCWDYDNPGAGDDEDDGTSAGADGDGGDIFSTPFRKLQDALLEDAFYYLDEITAQVERLVEEEWEKVFRTEEWYTDATNPVQLIINTEAEYIDEEFATMLQDQRSRKLTRQMLIRNIVKYINTLIEFLADLIRNPKKNTVDSWLTFVDCVQRDIDISLGMWREHLSDRQGQLLDLGQRALELMKQLLSVKKPVDFGYLLQDKLLDDFGDCPTFVIRFCFEARSQEVDRETRERLMAVWAERTTYQKRDSKDKPTLGWSQPPSFLGSVDRSLAELEKPSGFFGRSIKKKRAAERQQKLMEEKNAKRTARQARRDADAAATKILTPAVNPKANAGAVEVTSLADVLK
ncbi:conserved hypothetical protein [Leishmania mexicana MHOM/GT/2001/U1103]|uniref:Uncharacterized protein n=1 Tax=Leishmania mexicana (strain MHOM/GT/2001/U1103) TaxID=929439 RepID=E9AZ02_LEIMU|nr:conserved hypothetical protein [Leishmania mexicana MHOM/GT/2001/U1103]CBZ28198.1 conserved hypothetical protein [Leishmania mexicana MHOM/GT/2001/U1103]